MSIDNIAAKNNFLVYYLFETSMCFKECETISLPPENQQNILDLSYGDLFIIFLRSLNTFQKTLFHLYVLNIHDGILRQIVMSFLNFEQKIMFLNIILWIIEET